MNSLNRKTELYGEPRSKLHLSIRNAEPGWDPVLERLGITVVMLPDNAQLVRALEESGLWWQAEFLHGAVLMIHDASPIKPTVTPPNPS